MELPLVSVICVCYNHEKFIAQGLDSVLSQTYPNLEIIIVDDHSTDNSPQIIQEYVSRFPQLKFIANQTNLGNCAAFNRGYEISKGDYIIDFATDDLLLPERISEQVNAFEKLGPDYGILFTDAQLINEAGEVTGYFYKRNADGSLKQQVPTGEIFAPILSRHFICTPTMMMRRSVFELLGGYDAALAYEDFDLWVRSAPFFKFGFLDKVLTGRRLHASQLSKQQYQPGDKQIFSTIEVFRKARKLVRNETEKKALINRIELELTQAVFSENTPAVAQLLELRKELAPLNFKTRTLLTLSGLHLPLRSIRKLYYRLRYNK